LLNFGGFLISLGLTKPGLGVTQKNKESFTVKEMSLKNIAKFGALLVVLGTLAGCGTWERKVFDPTIDQSRNIFGMKSLYFPISGAAVAGKKEKEIIAAHAFYMERNSAVLLTVVGSADYVSAKSANLALAKRRAETVRKALIAAGVDAKRIQTAAVVDLNPRAKGRDPAKSRKVDFIYR
jgi:outer membrane protein OmpA-like peptidoglycan-associated protein